MDRRITAEQRSAILALYAEIDDTWGYAAPSAHSRAARYAVRDMAYFAGHDLVSIEAGWRAIALVLLTAVEQEPASVPYTLAAVVRVVEVVEGALVQE